jgi:5-methylcytosine-specific restriction endonuclease McrA
VLATRIGVTTAAQLVPERVLTATSTRLRVFAELSDTALLERVLTLAQDERSATAQLIAGLAEVDRRKLYLGLGCASLFIYCTRILRLSQHAAYNRIAVARAARRFPVILDRLETGSLNLTAVRLLAPLLTDENHERLLDAVHGKGKCDVEILIAGLRPLTTGPASDAYQIEFTASREFHEKLRRARALLRHAVPSGDLAEIFGRALDALIASVEKRRIGRTDRPRAAKSRGAGSRHIPAAVKREVWARDNGRCAFVGSAGRCNEDAFLEYHHVVPFAHGGPSTAANIQLRCRAHNAYEADRVFTPLSAD